MKYWKLSIFVSLLFTLPLMAAPWKMSAVSGAQALAEFQRICVENYLAKDAFLAEIANDGKRWTKLTKKPPRYLTAGEYWRSATGEVGYVSEPDASRALNDPACHYTFVKLDAEAHQSLIDKAVTVWKLKNGYKTGKKNMLQTRWDFQNVGGVKSRIFVTSGLTVDGLVVSRFSISRHRAPQTAGKK